MKPLKTLCFCCFPERVLVLFVFSFVFWFSRMFVWFTKHLRKNKKKQKRKTNPYPRLGLKPLKTLLFLRFFPDVVLCFIWFYFVCLVFPTVFWFSKNLRENQKPNKTKPISKGGFETFKNFVFVFSQCFCWFSLVFFGILGFPECCCWFSKNIRENRKTNQDQTHIQTQGAQGRNNSYTIE